MSSHYTLPEKKIPVKGHYDVIVCGAGIAGISAALSAKRAGAKKVLLLEREYAPGGLATLGLVTIYLPLCDGKGRQVSFGIAEELMRLSASVGSEDPIPDCWLHEASVEERARARFRCRFNAGVFMCLAEKLLLDSGIEILYGAEVCDSVRHDACLMAVICLQREGFIAYEADGFVDASGDAVLFGLAGEQTHLYPLGNRQAAWYYAFETGSNGLRTLGSAPLLGERIEGGLNGFASPEKSVLMTEARKWIISDFLTRGAHSDTHALTTLPTIPQVRMSRRIVGKACMHLDDAFKTSPQSVGLISNWRVSGPVYEMPMDSLCGTVENLYAAGRIISADDEMWDIIRAIPCCAVSGEAAGIAAAVGRCKSAVPPLLEARGIPLHIKQLGPCSS